MAEEGFVVVFQKAAHEALTRLRERLAAIRTDRASPAVVENVLVEYGGAKLPIKQLASIATPDMRNILITPWDRSGIEAIAKALEGADVGTMPVVTGNEIRITLPLLSEERRKTLAREAGERVEEAQIRMRRARDEAFSRMRAALKEKVISEDFFFRQKQELEQAVKDIQKEIDSAGEQKEKEILGTL